MRFAYVKWTEDEFCSILYRGLFHKLCRDCIDSYKSDFLHIYLNSIRRVLTKDERYTETPDMIARAFCNVVYKYSAALMFAFTEKTPVCTTHLPSLTLSKLHSKHTAR